MVAQATLQASLQALAAQEDGLAPEASKPKRVPLQAVHERQRRQVKRSSPGTPFATAPVKYR